MTTGYSKRKTMQTVHAVEQLSARLDMVDPEAKIVRYTDPDDSDKKIAAELGMSMSSVANIRLEVFGKLKFAKKPPEPELPWEPDVFTSSDRAALDAVVEGHDRLAEAHDKLAVDVDEIRQMIRRLNTVHELKSTAGAHQ